MAICLCFMFGLLLGATPAYAYTEKVSAWSNLNFSENGNLSNVYSSPNGWTKGMADSTATSGAINLDKFNSSFYLSSSDLPSKLNEDADNYVLMINSQNSNNQNGKIPAVQYYTNSSNQKLDAYSNYKIVVWVRVLNGAQGSIYITGLDKTLGFERIDYSMASEWTPYTFYISTGKDTQSIKTELWLGSKSNNTSNKAVFYDNIEVFKLSNNELPEATTAGDKLVAKPTDRNDRIKYVSYDERVLAPEINANFEYNSLSDWTRTVQQMKVGTYAEIIDESNINASNAKGIEYLGTDLTTGNKNALVLYTEDDVQSYFGLKSKNIDLPIYETLKISVNVKVGENNTGSAFVKFVENDVLDANGNKIEEITPVSEQVEISSNSTNKYLNKYNTVTFYVKARSLYNTSFNLELWFGSEENEASGVVAFDTITIEYLSNTDYKNATAGTYGKKVELQSTTENFGITNATFNDVGKASANLTYPLLPANWTYKTSNENNVFYGVINTNNTVYDAAKSQFGNFANPGNPEGFLSTDIDTNNILLMHNFNKAYQTVTSSTSSVSANSFYKLSFAYKLLATAENQELLNVYITDKDDNVIYAEENIATLGSWSNYVVYLSTNSYTNELKVILSLGTEDNLVEGIAYIDNVTLVQDSTMTAETFATLAEDQNILDFQEGNFNLVKENGTNLLTALRYTGKLEEGTNPEFGDAVAVAGIVNALDTEDEYDIEASPNNTNTTKYLMTIQTFGEATYSMTAKDKLKLEADKYYKFSVWIKTRFVGTSETEYGAQFALDGLDEKLTGIVADEWKEYSIYVTCTNDTEISLKFALQSLDQQTAGMVFFDNYSYTVIEKDDYSVAQLNHESESNYLFIGDTDVDPEEDDTQEKTNNQAIAFWYGIPTILLAVALVLALVIYFMKKIKITKWEKKKVNEYDREKTVHRDVIRTEAEARRNAKVNEVRQQIAEYEQEKARIEDVHQEQLKEQRKSGQKGVSLADEREFKNYARRHTAIENRIAGLNKEIDKMNTAEYLLSLQHQIAVEKAKKERIAKETAYKK